MTRDLKVAAMKTNLAIYSLGLALSVIAEAQAQSPSPSAGAAIPVTVENFVRAESDLYISVVALKEGGFGKFEHHRELSSVDAQTIIRMNRDTLYSSGIFDLAAAPVTITLPDPGRRYMSLQVISEDQYTPLVAYVPGHYTIDELQVGTRYAMLLVRTLADPRRTDDMAAAHRLQDAVVVVQGQGAEKQLLGYVIARSDESAQAKAHDAYIEE